MTTPTEVKERPILFSTPMIKAIIENRKTVTRRVMDIQPNNPGTFGVSPIWGYGVPVGLKSLPRKYWNTEATVKDPWNYFCVHCATNVDGRRVDKDVHCRYGKPGDVLWVRETWSKIHYEGIDDKPTYLYRADQGMSEVKRIWRPSIFMPREACRISLEITDIGVERLQDITEEDAIREGILFYDDSILGRRFKDYEADASAYGHPDHDYPTLSTARESFFTLWQSINGPESWNDNPWVWKISFKWI